jgi:hypothetical protein
MNPQVKKYFEDKGVEVQFDVLASTDALRKAFIRDTYHIVNESERKSSQFVKHQCFTHYYPQLVNRNKLTGFEVFTGIDREFRNYANNLVTEIDMAQADVFTNEKTIPDMDLSKLMAYASDTADVFPAADVSTTQDYLLLLKDELTKFTKPILMYMSGGLDSEFVATAMLEQDIKFIPVIFQWTAASGEIANDTDIALAFDFCEKNGLTPLIETVNIEDLWASDKFKSMIKQVQLISPQLLTHVCMVDHMHELFPQYSHLFGGEVRYTTNYEADDGSMWNMVYLTKVTPGYNGLSVSASAGCGGGYASLNVYYNYVSAPMQGAVYEWYAAGSGSNVSGGGSDFGLYASPPLNPSGYDWRVVGAANGGSVASSTFYTVTNGGAYNLMNCSASDGGNCQTDSASASGTIYCRSTGTVSPVVVTTFFMSAFADGCC